MRRSSVWEGSQVLAEHNGSTGAVITDYVYAGSRMIAKVSGGTTQYLLSDRWSTRLVLDTSGNVLGRQGHLAFGDEFAESGTQEKHHFTSYESESESGTDYAVNRQYSQSVGRFGSADLYHASSYLVNPQSWNRCSYVENDPIHNVDPLGLLLAAPGPGPDPCCVLGGCGGGDSEPAPRTPCADKDFLFVTGSGRYTSSELQALAQMAVGEAGGFFDRQEIEAVISTAVNRQNYNIAYINGGANRGPFNGGTSILGILEEGYDAHNRQSGQGKSIRRRG